MKGVFDCCSSASITVITDHPVISGPPPPGRGGRCQTSSNPPQLLPLHFRLSLNMKVSDTQLRTGSAESWEQQASMKELLHQFVSSPVTDSLYYSCAAAWSDNGKRQRGTKQDQTVPG